MLSFLKQGPGTSTNADTATYGSITVGPPTSGNSMRSQNLPPGPECRLDWIQDNLMRLVHCLPKLSDIQQQGPAK